MQLVSNIFNCAHVQAAELADLEDEANMPLEQLLARYGYTSNTSGATAAPSLSPSSNAAMPEAPSPGNDLKADPHKHTNKPAPKHVSREQSAVPVTKQEPSSMSAQAEVGLQHTASAAKLLNAEAVGNAAEAQAHQAAAAGMDAFEHSQALAERRASGSQAGPSSSPPSIPGAVFTGPCDQLQMLFTTNMLIEAPTDPSSAKSCKWDAPPVLPKLVMIRV